MGPPRDNIERDPFAHLAFPSALGLLLVLDLAHALSAWNLVPIGDLARFRCPIASNQEFRDTVTIGPVTGLAAPGIIPDPDFLFADLELEIDHPIILVAFGWVRFTDHLEHCKRVGKVRIQVCPRSCWERVGG